MPYDGFLDNDDEAPELIKFWENLGCPGVPPEFEHMSIEDAADHAISLLRFNLTALETLLFQTTAIYGTIKYAAAKSKPVTVADRVTASACIAAADDATHQLLCELTPVVRDLRERAFADDLTVLKLAKITEEVLKLQPKIEQVMRWHEGLKRSIARGMAQLN